MFASAAIAHLLAVMSPGPDTAIIFHQALTKGRSAGIFTALGIGFGIFIHCLFAISGISLLIYSTEEARFIVQCAGASYFYSYASVKSGAVHQLCFSVLWVWLVDSHVSIFVRIRWNSSSFKILNNNNR